MEVNILRESSRTVPRAAEKRSSGTGITMVMSGGLGNQMFQYAAGRAVALRCQVPLSLDISFYRKGRHRAFELESFPIAGTLRNAATTKTAATWSALRRLWSGVSVHKEPHFHYTSSIQQVEPPAILSGYFQSTKYFESYASTVREELAVPDVVTDESMRLAKEIQNCRATILHIRRGDYVTNPKAQQMFASCEIDYYVRAMESIPGSDPVFVFSDDIAWARKNLPEVKPLQFVGEGSARSGLEDLKLMTLGYHHVIANSTFSWWGAWLASPEKGRTIAPLRWFVDETMNDTDLIPSEWCRL